MAGLRGSVGRGGVNQRPDVVEVQTLLNRHQQALALTRPLAPDGICGQMTIAAILAFQARVQRMPAPDGRVDPGGQTLLALQGQGNALGGVMAVVGAAAAGLGTLIGVMPPPPGIHYTPGAQAPLADIAVPYIGATEARGNSMGTDPRMREIFEADHLMNGERTDGYAWCCSFVSMCVQKLIARSPAFGGVTPPRTAGVTSFRTKWAPAQNCLIFAPGNPVYQPFKGDVVIYTFSHIGIVTAVSGQSISTIEGNTNAAGSREGTTVMRKERALSLVRCFIRLPLRGVAGV
jgi:CHAP domain